MRGRLLACPEHSLGNAHSQWLSSEYVMLSGVWAGTGELIARAAGQGRAVPAFNVITLEHAEAIAAGAGDAGVPVLFQLSQNAIAYHQAAEPLLAACREIAAAAPVPIGLHLDHLDLATMRRLPEGVRLIVPRGAGAWLRRQGWTSWSWSGERVCWTRHAAKV